MTKPRLVKSVKRCSRLFSSGLMICAAVRAEYAMAEMTTRLELSNDIIISSDNQFTNGTSVVISSEPVNSLDETGGTPAFGKSLLAWAIPDKPGLSYRESWVLGQNMQTPEDIEQSALIENDVPFVGFLAWGNSFYGFDDTSFFGAQWLFGWVGEQAFGEQS